MFSPLATIRPSLTQSKCTSPRNHRYLTRLTPRQNPQETGTKAANLVVKNNKDPYCNRWWNPKWTISYTISTGRMGYDRRVRSLWTVRWTVPIIAQSLRRCLQYLTGRRIGMNSTGCDLFEFDANRLRQRRASRARAGLSSIEASDQSF